MEKYIKELNQLKNSIRRIEFMTIVIKSIIFTGCFAFVVVLIHFIYSKLY